LIHNQLASTWTLARSMRSSLDVSLSETKIPTQTLALLLDTIIALAERDNPIARKVESNAAAFVASRISGVEH